MSLLKEGLKVGRVLAGPALIALTQVGCNAVSDVEFNPINCSKDSQTRSAHVEVFLSPGQEIDILNITFSSNQPGNLLIGETYRKPLKNNEDGSIDLKESSTHKLVHISPKVATENGENGTLLSMDWSCD